MCFYFRILICIVATGLCVASLLALSWLGFFAVAASMACFVSWAIVGRQDNLSLKVLSGVVVIVSVAGFFSDLKYDPRTAAIFNLTVRASTESKSYRLSRELTTLANETMRACSFSTVLAPLKAVFDGTAAVYEPGPIGVFTWFLKPTFDKDKCANSADKIATGSERFAAELAQIKLSHDRNR